MLQRLIILFIICFTTVSYGNKLHNAYTALSIYDYFKAKQLFYNCLKKYPVEASYGLATIYERQDNPFHQLDSAAKYISVALTQVKDEPKIQFSGFIIDKESIKNKADSISTKAYKKIISSRNELTYNHFLETFYFAPLPIKLSVLEQRDQLLFNYYTSFNKSDSITPFLVTYPESHLRPQALITYDRLQYNEQVPDLTEQQLIPFISHYTKNKFQVKAQEELYNLYTKEKNISGLETFVRWFPNHTQTPEAWKLIYTLSISQYNQESLTAFLKKYPEFPFKKTIEKEMSLSSKWLLPFEQDGKFGYIDTLGNITIKAIYDEVTFFHEGLAVVSANDAYYYITKEGLKPFDSIFEEAYTIKNNVAVVKHKDSYYLMNRTGQFMAGPYQVLNEESDGLLIAKKDKYGAIDIYGNIIIPFNYDKLGDFKNNYAYYAQNNNYGFISKTGKLSSAKYEWLSELYNNQVFIVKSNNKYGIISYKDNLLLPTDYDKIEPCLGGHFLVVKNDKYGFFHSSGCLVTKVEFDYKNELQPTDYCNGTLFKLLKDNKVGIVDANGRMIIDYGVYDAVHFNTNGLLRVVKKGKHGFIDTKQTPLVPLKYELATDYKNNQAIVVNKDGSTELIDVKGNTIVKLTDVDISTFNSSNYYLITSKTTQLKGLLNNKGALVIPMENDDITPLHAHFVTITKAEQKHIYSLAQGKQVL